MELHEVIDNRAVIIGLDNPSPIAYINIYEQGDIWIKTQDCEACLPENRIKCCNNCGMFSDIKGCWWHLARNLATSKKPFGCIVKPYPDASMPFCALEFKCVRGSHSGQIRRVKDTGNVFQQG